CFFFFFSSRRRHTRWPRDWSSDVCSSDLAPPWPAPPRPGRAKAPFNAPFTLTLREGLRPPQGERVETHLHNPASPASSGGALFRSEERRVGKECRSRGAP